MLSIVLVTSKITADIGLELHRCEDDGDNDWFEIQVRHSSGKVEIKHTTPSLVGALGLYCQLLEEFCMKEVKKDA